MNATAGSTARSRAIVALILGYFVVVAYATVTNDPLALTVAAFGFGGIAIAVGAVLYQQAADPGPALLAAAGSLVAGGLLQFVAVLAASPIADGLASMLVFLGVGCYVVAVWSRST
ncbi:hypothetical protein [Natrinema versiforme]|uniref:Uncharacterized protein n=1 Tax=Natrinema versiforme JCM 10478 TaxID=1227496 RepID=L9YDA0_9EURY|nr:hypothetical protein [Natrinema versiforme]ELY70898.1 hypothetical protein C489_01031 [Natrinema versiforme JCM 10478]